MMAEPSATPVQGDALSSFNLQVVSPSASVNRPLSFPGIAASTTVRQLKEKIRNAVEVRPADNQQRLIHRGRLLARDDETLENILGTEAIRSGEQQTLHLVLRDLPEHHHAAALGTPIQGQSPAPATLPQRPTEAQQRILNQQQPRPHQHHHPHPHVHPQPHQHIHAGHAYLPGNRPLTGPIMMPGVMLPMPDQPNGPFPPPAGIVQPHEHLAIHTQQMMAQMQQMMTQHQQRAGTPLGGARTSPHPPPDSQDLVAQLSHQLAQNAQQQENLANQAEQITVILNTHAPSQPGRAAGSQQFVHQGNILLHRGHHLMGEAQQLVDRSQRERAAAGLHGIQDHGQANIPGQAVSGRNSPANGQPLNVTREMVGPNGEFIRMTTTVNGHRVITQTGQPAPAPAVPSRGPMLPNDLQTVLRGAEASQATQAMTNAMHRSASGASLANMANPNAPIQPIVPGVTTSIFRNASHHGSRTATPDPSRGTPNQRSSSVVGTSQHSYQRQTSQAEPEVYIMSSPTGPHALLVTNQGTYFTPQPVRQPTVYSLQHQVPGVNVAQGPHPAQRQQGLPDYNQLQERAGLRARQNVRDEALAGLAPLANANGQVNPAINIHQHQRPPNVVAAGIAAAIWPHVWLLIRLAAFIWWFTAADSSWSRLITVVLIAIVVFAVNTGLFNGVVHQAWDPFRRHLEGLLLPAAANPHNAVARGGAPPVAGGAVDNNRGNPAAAPGAALQPHQAPPNPAEAAARLVAQRQQINANWVMDHIRRVERAGLLFLASIAPGVAERHIAHLEQEERNAAQEQARLEAAEAAEAAAQVAAASEETEGGEQARAQGEAENAVVGQEYGPVDGQRQEAPLIPV